eukprot:TRINITY_DN7603_c0_g1_i1.p1 TRINITY_DN7603_c0_g1~~TRINITY_DN7603_c0_g1_i1.p1  ORF type:complete len:209 (+),score=51.18 TRINITY_DN7603_c0_g1_i1:76-702(+)
MCIRDRLEAVDSYCYRHHWMMHCGDKKGRVLDAVLNEKLSSHPQGKSVRLLELGVYCGYSGVRMCRQLRPGDQLVSIDIQPESVALADRLLSKAGLRSGVTLIQGTLEELLGPGETVELEAGFDFVFLDHDKKAYLQDLKLLETRRLLNPGCTVVADNVLFFEPLAEYLEYVRDPEGPYVRSSNHEGYLEYSPEEPKNKDGIEVSIHR